MRYTYFLLLPISIVSIFFLKIYKHNRLIKADTERTQHIPEFGVPFKTSFFSQEQKNAANIYCNLESKIPKEKWWQFLEKKYAQAMNDAKNDTRKIVRIPKKIHQIWLGGSLPEKNKVLQHTWLEKHPDWEYKLWTEKEIENFGLTNKILYDNATNYGHKSDIARYEIIYREGGLYVDTDYECLSPLDIFHESFDFYAGIMDSPEGELTVHNSILASIPGHPILQNCIQHMSFKKVSNAVDVFHATGQYLLTKYVLEHLEQCNSSSCRCIVLPPGYFAPWPYWERLNNRRDQILRWVKPETFAIHHWFASWLKQH